MYSKTKAKKISRPTAKAGHKKDPLLKMKQAIESKLIESSEVINTEVCALF
jgi:hypothetical protein